MSRVSGSRRQLEFWHSERPQSRLAYHRSIHRRWL